MRRRPPRSTRPETLFPYTTLFRSQVLTESGLLPGALLRNAGGHFVCRDVALTVENAQSAFTSRYDAGEPVTYPVAHHDGNYFADAATLDRLEGEGRVEIGCAWCRERVGTYG